MNGTLEEDDIENFLAEAGLYNLITSKHSRNTPPTYIRGSWTIDHMFGTPEVLNVVEAIGMMEFLKYFQSDHRGIFLDLYMCNIFARILHLLQQCDAQKVQLKAKVRTTKYLKRATVHIKEGA
eukprot:6935219-Ditylum_brightwellii.AAC.2